ncbi:MAG: hypothetical protein MJZ79_07735 [Paludibacteraceae bacterium]|nr:hypothetical protein [Paludibacteraceae bacterium]
MAKVYLITYDLNKDGKDYANLYQKIKDIAPNAWIHPLESVWCLRVQDIDANSIYNQLRPSVDDVDNLFIVEITNMDRQGWMPKNLWVWLKESVQK